jgi:four helix bundle protein
MALERFDRLAVWQEAHRLALSVYRTTAAFPPEERFGLVAQMRRAAVSAPANIAEGFKRRGCRDKARFCNIGQGSLEELRHYFVLCRDLALPIDHQRLSEDADRVGRMLSGLVAGLLR